MGIPERLLTYSVALVRKRTIPTDSRTLPIENFVRDGGRTLVHAEYGYRMG
jgi:hypothetical protein